MNFFKEPLLHFLLIGAAFFIIYNLTTTNSEFDKADQTIVISDSDLNRLSFLFEKTWKRPPNNDELKNIVDDYVKEEVLYREAIKLGLEKNDTIVRRRMRQKMEFFINDVSNETSPNNEELEIFLKDNSDKFKLESQVSFYQIFFKTENKDENLIYKITDLKKQFNNQKTPIEQTNIYSESIMLPFYMSEVSESEISRQFGQYFKDILLKQKEKIWEGPIQSDFGYHLVYIDQFTPEYTPKLSEIRSLVEEEWKYDLNKKLEEKYFQEKISQYNVKINWPENIKQEEVN